MIFLSSTDISTSLVYILPLYSHSLLYSPSSPTRGHSVIYSEDEHCWHNKGDMSACVSATKRQEWWLGWRERERWRRDATEGGKHWKGDGGGAQGTRKIGCSECREIESGGGQWTCMQIRMEEGGRGGNTSSMNMYPLIYKTSKHECTSLNFKSCCSSIKPKLYVLLIQCYVPILCTVLL